MPIYDRPTKVLMREFVERALQKSEVFAKEKVVQWFSENYPKINPLTIKIHVEAMCVNNSNERKHHPIHPNSNHDLFFKLGKNQYRVWDKQNDPAPIYPNLEEQPSITEAVDENEGDESSESLPSASEFAFERDLANYLAKNLESIEKGLTLFEEDGLTGVEFNVGGRRIDLLAVDKDGNFVVIELKVSRGYDRTIGQLLRYMSWIKQNMATGKKVRGLIMASNITEDLKLAASMLPDVQLAEYELAFKIKPVMCLGK